MVEAIFLSFNADNMPKLEFETNLLGCRQSARAVASLRLARFSPAERLGILAGWIRSGS
jgi:hypothetical protein